MNANSVPRILIADHHRLLAEACAKVLQPEFEVVQIVTDARALLQAALKYRPDAAIVDVFLPPLNGLDAVATLKGHLSSLKLLFLSANPDPALAAEAFRLGASGYILQYSGAEEFTGAIRRVLRGQSYLSPLIARETMTYLLERPEQQKDRKRITRRQHAILQLLAEGRAMKDIADVLDIAPGTVAFHKYKMMERLGITTNAGLLLYAMRQQLIAA